MRGRPLNINVQPADTATQALVNLGAKHGVAFHRPVVVEPNSQVHREPSECLTGCKEVGGEPNLSFNRRSVSSMIMAGCQRRPALRNAPDPGRQQ
jgi:hypothetical protein